MAGARGGWLPMTLSLDLPPLDGLVQRRRPGKDTLQIWTAMGGAEEVFLGEERFRAESLPAVAGLAGQAQYLLLMALSGDDLAFFGFPLQPDLCRPGLGEKMIEELVSVARDTDRKGLTAVISNADVLPLWFLQHRGFNLAGIHPLGQGLHRGYSGILHTHLFTLKRVL